MTTPPDQPIDPDGAGRPASAPDGGPHNPRPDAALTSLLREVRAVREKVDSVARYHADLSSSVAEELAPVLANLRRDVNDQGEQLNRVLRRLEDESTPPVDWPALTASQAEKQWRALGQWVAEVLVPWYEVTRDELPDCWALHRPAVVELSWLRTTRIHAHRRDGGPMVIADWHLRWRSGVLQRVRGLIMSSRLCRPGEHNLTEEDSRAKRQAASPGPVPAALPTAQLAEYQFWGRFYEQAVQEDLAWRRAREAQTGTTDEKESDSTR